MRRNRFRRKKLRTHGNKKDFQFKFFSEQGRKKDRGPSQKQKVVGREQ